VIDRLFALAACLHGGDKARTELVAEWHAFTQGICEVLCPWPPRLRAMTAQLRQEIEGEHHYYMTGRAAGVLAWIGLAMLIRSAYA